MILHRLMWRFLRHKDDNEFYRIMGLDTVRWLVENLHPGPGTKVLDLGTGFGIIGGELAKAGCDVTLADTLDSLLPEYSGMELQNFDIEESDFSEIGEYDLVIFSNVFEHLARPWDFIGRAHELLAPGGVMYLSWTNWLSPWGGHEFSPFHYLGPRLGPRAFDRLIGRQRVHTPYVNLFPTSIGGTLRMIRSNPHLSVSKVFPRYYPGASFVTRIPLLREFLAWNCVILIERDR